MRTILLKHFSKIFLVGDYVLINLILYFLYSKPIDFNQDYKDYFFLLNISWFVITTITKPYKFLKINDSSLHFNALTKSFILLVVTCSTYIGFVNSINTTVRAFVYYFLLLGFSIIITRFLLFLYRKKYRLKRGRELYSLETVLVGENKLSTVLLSNKEVQRSIGILGTYSSKIVNTKNKYLGNIDQLIIDLENVKISNIIFCDDDIDAELYREIVQIAEQKMIRIFLVPDFKYANLGPNYLDFFHGIPLLKLIKEPLSKPEKQFLKRTFDIFFSLFIIIFVLSWIIPIISLIIKLESGESAFFYQKRSGLKNKSFNCIKFRSMISNNNADIQTVSKNDKRVTKFGAFIRKTSIDELPQFINVFMGDMSVVGPRPHMLSQTEIYSKITKKYMTRHMVKPGITGWAQVMGARGEIFSEKDMENRIEKDIWYIQNWSFFLDLKIIFLTLYNIVKGDEQAY